MSCASINRTHSGLVIDLYQHNEMHFVNITLNGIETKLLVDTGASKSLLDITQADIYGFKYALLSENQYAGLGGLQDIYITYEYKVKEFHIPFLGTDLSEVQAYFTRDGMQIAGVLGSDFLENQKAFIDFGTNKLYIK